MGSMIGLLKVDLSLVVDRVGRLLYSSTASVSKLASNVVSGSKEAAMERLPVGRLIRVLGWTLVGT